MQIVIDIDEDLYKSIIAHRCKTRFQQRCDYEDLKNAIEDGTLLPKGHGRLIDADRLRSMYSINRANFNTVVGIQKWVDNAPTILEADKEEE